MKVRASFRLVAQSFSYIGPDRGRYVLGSALSSLELALLFATPYVNQSLIELVTGERQGSIVLTLAFLLMLFLLLAPLVVWGKYMQSAATYRGAVRMRREMFHRVMSLPYQTLTQRKTGDYITRLTEDVNNSVTYFGSYAFTHFFRFLVVFSVTLVLLLIGDWHIALAGVIYGSINMALSMYLNPRAKSLERDAMKEISGSASFLIETLRAIPVIKVFVLHRELAEHYRKISGIIREKRMKYQTVIGITYGTVDFFAQSAQAVGFIIGILLAGDEVSLGSAVFNATLMGMMADSIYRLSTFLLLSQPKLVAMERAHSILSLSPEELSAGDSRVDTSQDIAVEFRDVSFSYDGETNVISHLDLTLHRGEHLAIVGGSGGGKSTVLKLMEGFYAPTSGEIRYFDRPAGELSLAAVRGLFAYIPQECTLFEGTIGENIALGSGGADSGSIRTAAQTAGIDEFIQTLPGGYDTQVGERGSQLSGGQRQRIAIARGLLRNAPVLLLDEATASLDSAMEQEIQQCLDTISQGVTTITVAHRLSTIQNAHRILVMEGGRVIEEGTFQSLLAQNGRFRELYESQQRDEI